MAALAIAAGLLIGASLGALGGGGSILTVPALVYLLGLSPHRATTASLLVVGVAAVVGAVAHARGGRVRLKTGAMFGALGVAGSYAGSLLSATVPANLLLAGFGLLMLAVAALMLLRRQGRAQPATGQVVSAGARRIILVAAAATGVGLVTGFFGVGGGLRAGARPGAGARLRHAHRGRDFPGGDRGEQRRRAGCAGRPRRPGAGLEADRRVRRGRDGRALAGGGLAWRASPQRLSVAFSVLVVLVAGYTLTRSLPGLV